MNDFRPSFDENGNINMGEVISAHFADFAQYDIDVAQRLREIRDELTKCGELNYLTNRSNYIHHLLSQHETPERKERQAGHQLTPLYCFYYNVYCFINNLTCHNMLDAEIFKRDIEVLGCEIAIVKNPFVVIGRNNTGVKELKGKIVEIPKGCPYMYRNKPGITSKKHKVFVHLVNYGYYHHKVFNPSIIWAGSGGYWMEAELKDIYKETT